MAAGNPSSDSGVGAVPPTSAARFDRGVNLFLFSLPFLIGIGAGPNLLDDAYITLRYARSIAAGAGFVYNPGEFVLGTTTPLFALLLALLHRLTAIDLETLAFGGALVGHGLTLVWIARAGAAGGYVWAGRSAALLVGLMPIVWLPTFGGMETSLFVAATLYALAPWTPRFRDAPTVAAVAALLLRPEGLIVLGLHLLRQLFRGRRFILRALLFAGVLVLPWLVFATWYFGNPVPQSMRAKWAYHALLPPLQGAESFWYTLLATPISGPPLSLDSVDSLPFGELTARRISFGGDPATRRALILAAGLILLVLVGAGAVTLFLANRQTLWLLVYAAVYVAAYSIANPHIFPWYLVPPIPIVTLCLCVCVEAGRRYSLLGAASLPAARVLAAAAIALGAWQLTRFVTQRPVPREKAYAEAVRRLGAPAQDPHTLIGAVEIGVVGYYSRARILDHAGLVSPQVLTQSVNATVDQFRPQYYIGADLFLAMFGLRDQAAFAEHYEPIVAIPASCPDCGSVRLYRRIE